MKAKLLAYSTAATALLGSTIKGRSQVVYTDIEPDIIGIADPDDVFDGPPYLHDGDTQFFLDLDGNGTNDVNFRIFGNTFPPITSASGSASGIFAFLTAVDESFRFVGATTWAMNLCCYPVFVDYYNIVRFSQGENITEDLQWTHGGPANSGYSAVLMVSHFLQSGWWSNGTTNEGEWNETDLKNTYIGFRKNTGGNYNYGWIRLSTEFTPRTAGVTGSMYFKATFHDFAFNNTINEPVYAGEGLPECVVPISYDAIATTPVTAKIKWSPVYAANNYQIFYRPVGAGAWQKASSIPNQKKLTDLTCNTTYEWKVRARCGVDNTEFSIMENFTTPSCKISPDGKQTLDGVFPNPVTQFLNIDISDFLGVPLHITVTNIEGKNMHSRAQVDGSDLLQIDCTNYPKGIYLLTIQSPEMQKTMKFIVE